MKKEGAVGIYGGTFSPPHKGHLHAISAFFAECPLDRLYVVPAFIPPHKEVSCGVTAADRLEMTKTAMSSHPEWGGRLFVSDFEIKKGGKSYSVDTVRYFHRRADSLYFLIGTDMLLTFEKWYKPEVICKYARLVCVRREKETPGAQKDIEKKIIDIERRFDTEVILLKSPALPMDSTSLRESLRLGEKPAGLDPGVIKYIEEHGLYRELGHPSKQLNATRASGSRKGDISTHAGSPPIAGGWQRYSNSTRRPRRRSSPRVGFTTPPRSFPPPGRRLFAKSSA